MSTNVNIIIYAIFSIRSYICALWSNGIGFLSSSLADACIPSTRDRIHLIAKDDDRPMRAKNSTTSVCADFADVFHTNIYDAIFDEHFVGVSPAHLWTA